MRNWWPVPIATAGLVNAAFSMNHQPSRPSHRWKSLKTWRRRVRQGGWLGFRLLVAALFLVWWFVIRIEERDSWPPPDDAVTSAQASETTRAFLGRDDVSIDDLAIPLAPSTAATVDFFSGGEQFFPATLDDLKAAEASIHIMMFSITPGEMSSDVVEVLTERAEARVEVRLIVDRYGAKVYSRSSGIFDDLADAGVDVVVNDIFPVDHDGLLGDGNIDWWQDELGNADHRKMLVIDGRVGWIGGAGFEDHFVDGQYHDAFVRVTGDVLRQMQLVFLTSYHVLGGPLDDRDNLVRFFPSVDNVGSIPATLLHNVPGGHVPATQAIGEVIDNTDARLDILNPYMTDAAMQQRVLDAANRGTAVRIVVPGQSNVPPAQDAFQHNYQQMFDSGVNVYEYETIVHAKVVVADDITIVGTINFDKWALYRNPEIGIMFDDGAVAADARTILVEDVLSRSKVAEIEDGVWDRSRNWFWDKLEYFL